MARYRSLQHFGRSQWVRVIGLFFLLLLVACGNGTTAVAPTLAPTTKSALPPSITPTTMPAASFTPTDAPTETPSPPPSPMPSPTPSATPSATPTATPIPPEALVNGLPRDRFIVMDTAVQDHIRDIYAHGQALGRNPNAFSKVGDSVVLTPHYLARFDSREYDLGIYAGLQPTIDQFTGSFARFGQVAHVGLSSRTLFELGWADDELCLPNENAVDCEIRLHNPGIFLIRLGTNDLVSDAFEANMRQLITHLLDMGIIPILGTKPDRFEGEGNTNNDILRALAAEYRLPLWDYDLVAETLPERGLSGDAIHLTMSGANDYTDPAVLEKGYAVSDLTALMVLDAVRLIIERAP